MYALIVNYSFDDDVPVYLFTTEESAINALEFMFERELCIDTQENEWDVSAKINDDKRYAKLIAHFSDHDDVTEFRIGNVRQYSAM